MTDAYCLRHVKNKLGGFLEKSDEEILEDVIQTLALKTFSKYFPRDVDVKLKELEKVSGYESVWRFPDSIIGTFISIKQVLTTAGRTDYKVINDNTAVRIYGFDEFTDVNTILQFKVVHKKDLTSIPINQEDLFIEYCTILTAELILPIRKEFNRIGTPIGDIELNSETLQSYVDKKPEFKEKNFQNSAKFSKRTPVIFGAPYADSWD